MFKRSCLSALLAALLALTGAGYAQAAPAFSAPLSPVPCASPSAASEPAALPEAQNKLVAITFDDGPGEFTEYLLDELGARCAKATFFVLGNRIGSRTSPILKRMADEGHCVGNHTFSHQRLTDLSNIQIKNELDKTDDLIVSATGAVPELMRPTYGSYSKRVLDAANRPVILWSLDTCDAILKQGETARNIFSSIVGNVKDGDIILLHEWQKSSVDGAVMAIDALMEEGFSFVTVPELFEKRGISLEAGKCYRSAPPKMTPEPTS